MDRGIELALVHRLRTGDPAAFDAVYEEFRARIYTFLVRLTRRHDVAEDLAEETWLRLVAHAARLRADTRLGPWLFTVARNLYFSYRRARGLDDVPGIGLWPVAFDSPFEEAAASELAASIERALSSLPPHDREVLLLVGAEGLTPAEAAAVCAITPEALRQRLSRARERLAAALDRHRANETRDEALS